MTAASNVSLREFLDACDGRYPVRAVMSGYGYPYCLGRFIPIEQNRDPKIIYPSSPDFSSMMSVAMPHEFYIWMLKWCSRKLKEWWRREIVNGRSSADPRARHNVNARAEDVPRHVRFCMTWICACDAHNWDPRGFRWMCHEMYGYLSEEGIHYPEDEPVVSAKVVAPSDRGIEVVSMIRSGAGGIDSFFFPAANLLQLCGMDS